MLDDEVPAWWERLGLSGLVDVHVHFLPDSVMNAVWAYFDQAEAHYGVAWPVNYRTSVDERLATLRELGVRQFPALVYPHKPDMAAWLNSWAREFAAATPECVPSGTFYPEPGASQYVKEALELGTRIFKVHVQVGNYDPREDELDAVWGQLAEAGVPVVVHCGSGPIPGRHTGPGPMGDVLRKHPRLTAVIAHLGCRSTPSICNWPRPTRTSTSTPRWPARHSPRRWRHSRETCSRGTPRCRSE